MGGLWTWAPNPTLDELPFEDKPIGNGQWSTPVFERFVIFSFDLWLLHISWMFAWACWRPTKVFPRVKQISRKSDSLRMSCPPTRAPLLVDWNEQPVSPWRGLIFRELNGAWTGKGWKSAPDVRKHLKHVLEVIIYLWKCLRHINSWGKPYQSWKLPLCK